MKNLFVAVSLLFSVLFLAIDLEQLNPHFIDVAIESCYVAIKVTTAVYFSLLSLVIYAYKLKNR